MKLFEFIIQFIKAVFSIIFNVLEKIANNTIGKYAGTTYEGKTIFLFIIIAVGAGWGCWKLINRSDFR